MRTMEHRQENTEKVIKGLDQKYEGMMNMMAQIMAKLNDKGKEVETYISGHDQRIDLTKERPEKLEGRGNSKLPKNGFLYV